MVRLKGVPESRIGEDIARRIGFRASGKRDAQMIGILAKEFARGCIRQAFADAEVSPEDLFCPRTFQKAESILREIPEVNLGAEIPLNFFAFPAELTEKGAQKCAEKIFETRPELFQGVDISGMRERTAFVILTDGRGEEDPGWIRARPIEGRYIIQMLKENPFGFKIRLNGMVARNRGDVLSALAGINFSTLPKISGSEHSSMCLPI